MDGRRYKSSRKLEQKMQYAPHTGTLGVLPAIGALNQATSTTDVSLGKEAVTLLHKCYQQHSKITPSMSRPPSTVL
jgi:hypothetical protein